MRFDFEIFIVFFYIVGDIGLFMYIWKGYKEVLLFLLRLLGLLCIIIVFLSMEYCLLSGIWWNYREVEINGRDISIMW